MEERFYSSSRNMEWPNGNYWLDNSCDGLADHKFFPIEVNLGRFTIKFSSRGFRL